MITTKLFNCILIFITVFSSGICAKAQNKPYTEISIASPNAASLGKFTDIPVNYHTGIPQIEIPMYSIKAGPLSLPVSLSYHAGGLKILEPASWVGAGWALNAGGVITRTVRGAPDERNTTGISIYGHFSDFGYSNYLTISGGAGYPCSTGPCPNDNAFATAQYDGEPDLFTFNFGGYAGKFYFNDDRKPVLVPDQNIKIEYYFPADTAHSFTNQSSNIQGFTMTTPDGTKYYFGINSTGTLSGVDPIEISFPYSGTHTSPSDKVISSWFLNKVVSSDDLFAINLVYQSESYSYYTTSMFPVNNLSLNDSDPTNDYEYALAKDYIKGVRLSQVVFPNGKIDFTPNSNARVDLGGYNPWGFTDYANTEAKALGSISISDSANFCKKFSLYYSYFYDSTSTLTGNFGQYNAIVQTDRKRLKLDSIKEQTCDGTLANPPYKFEYDAGLVPRRLSFAQDHWGFYNGVTTNSTLIPTYTIDTFTYINGANRDSKWPEMKGGSLSKITYPTGGFTIYGFEPNTTWISATRYNNINRYYYSVGYDGTYTSNFTNVTFTNNHYQLIMSNDPCPGTSPCGATVYVKKTDGTVVYLLTLDGNQSSTGIMQIPAGTYNVYMTRSDTRTGTGASVYFKEIVPFIAQKNDTIGGLRIKTITQNDGVSSSNNIVTLYNYDVSGQSSGILYSKPTYVQIIRNDLVALYGFGGSTLANVQVHGCLGPETVPNNTQIYYISPCPIIPMANSQGNHIGYNEIKVTQSGKGYNIYRYYGSNTWDLNHDDVAFRNINPKQCISSIPNSPAPPLPFEYSRGSLKYEGQFNENGNVLKDILHTYFYDSSKVSTHGYKVSFEATSLLGVQYDLKTYWKKEEKTIETLYIPGGSSASITTTSYISSPYHHFPVKQVSFNSKGDSLITISKYVNDYRINNCDTISDGWQNYSIACHNCDSLLTVQLAAASNLTYQLMAWRDNLVCRANSRKNLVTTQKNNFTNSTNAFNTCHTNAKNAANSDLKPILQLQDDNNNNTIEVSNWRNNSLTSAFFYKFDYSSNPANEVYINKAQAINLSATTNTFTASANSNTAITKDSRYEDEATYKFNLGNPAEAKGRDGVVKSYIWDYKNSLPAATILNATSDQIAYTSFEADGKGNWNNYTGVITTATTAATMPPTGSKYYGLTTSATLSKTGIISGKKYIVSYWSKNGAYNITGGTNTSVTGKLINGWTYYEHTVTATSNTITISGTGSIDEVRLYPSDAQMTTYSYQPLIGISSQCDINNRISYYEYDALGRLRLIKDQDKNVLKKFYYNYNGQQVQIDPPANGTVTITNIAAIAGFTAIYTNTVTLQQTTITVPATGSINVTLPTGIYDVFVSRTINNSSYAFTACAFNTVCGGTLHNINISTCNTLLIDTVF